MLEQKLKSTPCRLGGRKITPSNLVTEKSKAANRTACQAGTVKLWLSRSSSRVRLNIV